MDFSAELQNILGNHKPVEIEELILDDLFTDVGTLSINHKKALEQYTSLVHLSMKNIGLEKLDNFPSIPSLQILELNNNKLNGKDFAVIPTLFPNLYKIKVSYNKIENMNVFEAFGKTIVVKIEVKGNPFTESNGNYTNDLFKLLPEVQVIDGHDEKGQEIDSTNYDEEEEEDESIGENESNEENEEFEESNEEDGEEGGAHDDDDEEEDEQSEEQAKNNKKRKN